MTYEDAFIPFVTLHVIAVAMAIGMFFGLIPLCGLKTLPAIGITRLLRGSIVGAAIGVTLHTTSSCPWCRCCLAGNTTWATGF